MAVSDLHSIKCALQGRLANEPQFMFLNTRIILRTGVDLSGILKPVTNPDSAKKVLTVLREMGFDLSKEIGE